MRLSGRSSLSKSEVISSDLRAENNFVNLLVPFIGVRQKEELTLSLLDDNFRINCGGDQMIAPTFTL